MLQQAKDPTSGIRVQPSICHCAMKGEADYNRPLLKLTAKVHRLAAVEYTSSACCDLAAWLQDIYLASG